MFAVLEQVAPHDALALLGHRDVEQERRGRRQVDAADVVDDAAVDRLAAGQERGPHVGVGVEVLHVRHVAVLAEERRAREQRAGRRRVVLVRRVGEHDQVARPGRVRHVGGAVVAVRDVARLGLRVDPVDHVPALGLAVAGPVVGVLERFERGLDPGHLGGHAGGRDLLVAGGRVAAHDVEVDLQRAAGVARLRLADRLGPRRRGRRRVPRAAVGGLGVRQQAEVDEHLARVDRQELRREAVVGGDERRQVLVLQAVLRQAHRRVGALVRAADERLALLDAAVRRAVGLDVVVRGVLGPVRQPLGDEPEELVLDLVGHRVADHRQVRLVLVEDVLDQRVVAGLPVQALLDVGLLAHDAGLEDGEVAGLRGREALGHEVLEAAGEARLARPRRPGRVRARHRGVEETDLREVGGQPLDLDQEGAGLAVRARWWSGA